MRAVILGFALAVIAAPVAASDKADVMAVVNRFNDSMNKGDVKTASATCANPTSIIDEFPPYGWNGPKACEDWANDFDVFNKKSEITDPFATLRTPRHVDITGDNAYVVIPATYTYKEKKKKMTEPASTLTVALKKSSGTWTITEWAWSKHSVQAVQAAH